MNPNKENIDTRLEMMNQLKTFLVTAPEEQENKTIQTFDLSSTGESISCIKWNDTFFITGTDIIRCLLFRFTAFGRPIKNIKKFEEGIFSDLRNLKPGTDAILEEPKSIFLDLLFKHNCIRTQKKQKVFYWYSVPHDRLFLDALERDLKRERLGIEPTSIAIAYPADIISLDTTQAMLDEFRKAMLSQLDYPLSLVHTKEKKRDHDDIQKIISSTLFGPSSLFKGSPSYKQRRHRVTTLQQQQQQTIIHNKKKSFTLKEKSCITSKGASESSESYRLFECPIPSCRKVFKRLEHMKRHLRTHTLERPYLCDLCGKRFSRSDNLAQHKKTHIKSSTKSNCRKQQQRSTKLLKRRLYHLRHTKKRVSTTHDAATVAAVSNIKRSRQQEDPSKMKQILLSPTILKFEEKEEKEKGGGISDLVYKIEEQEPTDISLVNELLVPSEWNTMVHEPSPLYNMIQLPYSSTTDSSCLTSPIIPSIHFLMTPLSHSVIHSPIMMHSDDEYYHYSDQSPTMTPTDALLYYH
ncbi:STE like transcription factor-domain-containing protein [Cokeromyces recurvatus]|uniref:STE like transcription factor-domain-containing protein n=1 Tax=Cokeromyces recurvatus TaxID=90255 RepID=UPI00221F0BD8|nr:STE like transcription factor-domain-containing protein [Cokeromyces recurvatus]KAI7897725.1 STE like transcription factor-domain-containing protein [Cokeromyces recurvatus]